MGLRPYQSQKLAALMRRARNECFLYEKGVGFCNGYLFLSDTEQVSSFVKNELMNNGNIFFRNGSFIAPSNLKGMYEKFTETEIKAEITPYFKMEKRSTLARIFKDCEGGVRLIDTEYLKIFADLENYKLSICPPGGLIVRDHKDKFIAMVLGIRSSDEEVCEMKSILNMLDETAVDCR